MGSSLAVPLLKTFSPSVISNVLQAGPGRFTYEGRPHTADAEQGAKPKHQEGSRKEERTEGQTEEWSRPLRRNQEGRRGKKKRYEEGRKQGRSVGGSVARTNATQRP